MLEFIKGPLHAPRLMVGLPVLFAVLFCVRPLLTGFNRTATSSFTPEVESSISSQYAGLAAQFGVSLPGASDGPSPQFYAELLTSRELLQDVVLTDYVVPLDDDTLYGNMIELLRIKEGEPAQKRLLMAIKRFSNDVQVGLDVDANLVTLETTTQWSSLSEAVNRRMLDLLNNFNVETRRSRAAAERDFVAGRLVLSQAELADAEAALQRFMTGNRTYQGAPQLVLEAARLQRVVDSRQQVVTGLASAAEKAQIDAVRDIPVITIIDQPEGSALASSSFVRNAVLGALLGLTVAIVVSMLMHLLTMFKHNMPEEYAELRALQYSAVARVVPEPVLSRLERLGYFRRDRIAARDVASN